MSAKSKKRKQQQRIKRARKKAGYRINKDGEGSSPYARKRDYLKAHGGWGWEYAEPKPWKGGAS